VRCIALSVAGRSPRGRAQLGTACVPFSCAGLDPCLAGAAERVPELPLDGCEALLLPELLPALLRGTA